MDTDIQQIQAVVEKESSFVNQLTTQIGSVIVGQKYLIERLLIGILGNGHILIEGVPGLAKTLSVKTLSDAIQTKFQRIQFTPDLLPADLIGTLIYNPQKADFSVKKGPIFANIILADEINRAPAKVQSALLEAMQERQVTIDGVTHLLPRPFLVMATQNPIELEGTFPLPEAQVDRFMLKIQIGYPSQAEENQILRRFRAADPLSELQQVATPEEIIAAQKERQDIRVEETIQDYIVRIGRATRENVDIQLGASPRATLSLFQASQAWAAIQGRDYVLPDDVKSMAPHVFSHRLIISPQAQLRGRNSLELIEDIVSAVPVPVEF